MGIKVLRRLPWELFSQLSAMVLPSDPPTYRFSDTSPFLDVPIIPEELPLWLGTS